MSMDPKKDKFAMVSEWMVHGDIIGYVKKHAGVNPVQLVSVDFIPQGNHFNSLT